MTNVTEPTLFRLRVAYPKLGRLKYLGHLELIHTCLLYTSPSPRDRG